MLCVCVFVFVCACACVSVAGIVAVCSKFDIEEKAYLSCDCVCLRVNHN